MVQKAQLARHTQLDAERRSVVSDDSELLAASRETGDSSATQELVTDRFAAGAAVEPDNIRAVETD